MQYYIFRRVWLCLFSAFTFFQSFSQYDPYGYFTPQSVHNKTLKLNSIIPPVFYYAISREEFIIQNTTGYHYFIIQLDKGKPDTLKPDGYRKFRIADINKNTILNIRYDESYFKETMDDLAYKQKNLAHVLDSAEAIGKKKNTLTTDKMLSGVYKRERNIPKAGDEKVITEYDRDGNAYTSIGQVSVGEEFSSTITSYSVDLLAKIYEMQKRQDLSKVQLDKLKEREEMVLFITELQTEAMEIMAASKGHKTSVSYLFQPQKIYNIIFSSTGGNIFKYAK